MRMWQGKLLDQPDCTMALLEQSYVVAGFLSCELDSTCFGYLLKRPEMLYKYLCDSQGNSKDTQTLKYNRFADIEVTMPVNLEEQRVISACLGRVDTLITLHQRKCQYRSLYGYLSWEQRKFADLTDRVSIQSSDPNLPQVEYEDIISGMDMLNKDLRDKEGGKTGIEFFAGDVLYGKLRPYLMNWLYPQFNGVAVGDFWVLRATECDSSFLYRLVQTDSFQRLANVSSGSKMPRADWNLISQSLFAVPTDHAEQKVIARSLTELDDLITLHQRMGPIFCFCAHGSRTNFASTLQG